MDKMTKIAGFFRSNPVHLRKSGGESDFFRSISVHFYGIFSYLRTGKTNNSSTNMAGTVKDMSLIKQVLLLKQQGESNRGVSRKLSINKETVNNYVKTADSNGWSYDDLLAKEDPELYRMFHAGSPAYSDPRMTHFLSKPEHLLERKNL